jgi:hypothetical protein
MRVETGRRFAKSIACGILLCAAASACAVAPHLASITPTSGQRGNELELSFHGERLQDAVEIIAYEPGLEVRRLNLVTNQLVKATVQLSPECGLGEHHLRLRTATGLSELKTFFVGAFPVVDEKEPNDTPAQAQKLALNTTVAGVITSEDVDCFAVELQKGARLSAEVEGMRLGRGVFDPRLTVLETNGTVWADVDDTWLAMQDPFVSLIAPHDGTFILQLREATYGGSGDCHYRLHVGNFPRPASVHPLGGKAGETVALTFFSEATGEFVQEVKLPATPQERVGVFAELDHISAPSPNWIRVSPFPNVLASGQTPDREHATVVNAPPPFALNGYIALKGEEDWFRFPATKGVPLDVNVYARQLRSPLDSLLDVFDAQGHSLAANDDAGGVDSALKFTPAESTNYFVRIRDTLGRFGRDFTYRIEITPTAPSIAVKIPEVARNDSQARQFIAVPRGNRFATLISAKRANLGSELLFDAPDLPPGVAMLADRLAANVESEPLVFEAAPDAPIGGRLVDLTAIGTNANGKATGHFRQEAVLIEGPNNTTYYDTRVDRLCVAVAKEAPFGLRIVEPKVPLVQAGSMALEIIAERKPGFDEPIEVQMIWNPPGVSSQSEATIPKGATNVVYQLNANDGAEARGWKIVVLGHALVDGGQLYVSSQLAALKVATPFLAGKIETLATFPGKPAKLTVKLQQLKPFSGKAAIRLLGLPEKVTAQAKDITKDDEMVSFDLTVDPKCAPGSFRNLFCAVEVMQEGHVVPHSIASGGILRILPVKQEAVKVAATAERTK